MASKQEYIKEISEIGIDKFPSLQGVDLESLHWMKLKDALESYKGENKTENTQNMSEDISKQYAKEIELLIQRVKELESKQTVSTTSQPNVIVNMPDKDQIWGSKKRVSLDSGDYEKEPTTFIKWGRGYVASSYFKDGTEMLAPYDAPIVFRYVNATKRNTGGADQLIHISAYRTHSKKEKEWMRNHPLYNKGIYEKMEQVLNYDPKLASAIESVSISIGAMSAQDIFTRANALGIDVENATVDRLKTQIITMEARQLLEQEHRQQGSQQAKMLDDILKA